MSDGQGDADYVRVARFEAYDEWGNLLDSKALDIVAMVGDRITLRWNLEVVEDDQGNATVISPDLSGPVSL